MRWYHAAIGVAALGVLTAGAFVAGTDLPAELTAACYALLGWILPRNRAEARRNGQA